MIEGRGLDRRVAHAPSPSRSYVKSVVGDLFRNKVDISLLVITKALTKADPDAYANPQAHVALAQKLAKRDKGSAPVVGDRVPYVIIDGVKGQKMFEKAEDPLYARRSACLGKSGGRGVLKMIMGFYAAI